MILMHKVTKLGSFQFKILLNLNLLLILSDMEQLF